MSNLLSRPPEEGARLLALRHLDAALAARDRLGDPEDAEALHDLRVALRRLRSTIRSYEPYLEGSLGRKLKRRLRDLAATTGPGRDAEVQAGWLRGEVPALARAQRSGAAWLLSRAGGRMADGYETAQKALEKRLPKLATSLRSRLSVYSTEVHLDGETPRRTFATATGEALGEQVAELGERLAAIAGPDDQEDCHEARIVAKRVRYLLEPLLEELPQAAALVKRFKGLQDLLGELHDAHVLELELGRELEEAALERARSLFAATLAGEGAAALRAAGRRSRDPGLLALARRNRERRDSLFATLSSRHLNGKADRFLEGLADFAAGLATPAGGAGEPSPAGQGEAEPKPGPGGSPS